MADVLAAPAAGSRPTTRRRRCSRMVRRPPARGWFDGDPTVVVDREEITVIGRLPEAEGERERGPRDRAASPGSARRPGQSGCGSPTRPRTSTAARSRGASRSAAATPTERILFTHIAVPVMTRLRQPERQVLDTLVDAGVARSRSDALAWSVKLVGEHADEWLGKLRDAMRNVDDLQVRGPAGLSSDDAFDADVGRAQRRGLRQRIDGTAVDEQVAVDAERLGLPPPRGSKILEPQPWSTTTTPRRGPVVDRRGQLDLADGGEHPHPVAVADAEGGRVVGIDQRLRCFLPDGCRPGSSLSQEFIECRLRRFASWNG